ncbi:MAG: hypothetical protein JNK89_07540, partial [Saprospiraceae bacterium]|nr:hypothetical protein [Saprospiraceae bacterium]
MKSTDPRFRFFAPILLFLAVSQIGTAQWALSYAAQQVQGNTPMVWDLSVVDSDVVWASVTRNYAIGASNI